MTARRHATARPEPRIEPDRDEPTPNCAGNPLPFDVLIDRPGDKYALRAARDLCGTCPLAHTCLPANRGETWAQAVLGLPIRQELEQSAASKAAQGVHAARRAARLDELHRLLERGADVDEAVRELRTTREGLYKWCHRWDHLDLWARLSPPRPEPVVRRDDSRRRKRVAA